MGPDPGWFRECQARQKWQVTAATKFTKPGAHFKLSPVHISSWHVTHQIEIDTGQGLGASGQGIQAPIKPSLKFDTTGIGHDPAAEFTSNWWEANYNK